MAKKKSLEETINQEVQQTQDYMSQASQLFREAWELQKQVPMWDNYDLSGLDDKAKEALQKQAQLLRDIAEQKFKNAQQIIDMASKEQAKDDEEKHLENGKNVKEIAPNASHFKLNLAEKIHEIALDIRNSVKETFNRWKEAVELTGQKLETIKDHAVEYRQAVTNAKKVAASIKAQDKMFNADIKMLEAQKEAILNRMKENEVAVMKMDDKAELLYEKAMRQNERAYSLELLKAGMTGIAKNMFGKKEEVMPPIMDYSTPKDPAAGQIKDLQDIAIATVKENRAMENELRSIEKEIALKTILHGQIEIPEGISKEDYNKATNRIRDALVSNLDQQFVYGKIDEKSATLFADLANQKDESGKYIYDVDQLRQIKIGLENKQEIEKFTNPELSAYKMSIIRGMDAQDIPLEKNVDEIVKMDSKDMALLAKESIEQFVGIKEFAKEISGGDVDVVGLMNSCYDSLQQTQGKNEPAREEDIAQAFAEGAREVAEIVEQTQAEFAKEAQMENIEKMKEDMEQAGIYSKEDIKTICDLETQYIEECEKIAEEYGKGTEEYEAKCQEARDECDRQIDEIDAQYDYDEVEMDSEPNKDAGMDI